MGRETFSVDSYRAARHDYGVLTCEPDRRHGPETIVYTTMLCIVPPNEWMKTNLGNILAPPEGKKD